MRTLKGLSSALRVATVRDERKGGANCAFGIVFVALGKAEIDQGTIAHEPSDESIELPYRIGDALMVRADDHAQVFRIQVRGHFRRTDQIAEQDGKLTALRMLAGAITR